MDTEQLKNFIEDNIPTFDVLAIKGQGTAYHYTNHADEIVKLGYFLGAPIDVNLDKTQDKLFSDPARNNPGVVFAYENLNDAIEEGFKCSIIKINYAKALLVNHVQEVSVGAPTTTIILNTDIIDFEKIEN